MGIWHGVAMDSFKFHPGPPCPTTLCPADLRIGVFLYISTWLTGQLFLYYIYEGTSTLWLSLQTSKVLVHLSFFQDRALVALFLDLMHQ
jgi:hypothetical protein